MPLKIKTLFLNLYSNLIYYLIFQLLFNLLLIYVDKNNFNKASGVNVLPYYLTLLITVLYSIPLGVMNIIRNSISIILGIQNNSYFYESFTNFSIFVSTFILCNLPPFSNKLKQIFKIRNFKTELFINIILILMIFLTFKKWKI